MVVIYIYNNNNGKILLYTLENSRREQFEEIKQETSLCAYTKKKNNYYSEIQLKT